MPSNKHSIAAVAGAIRTHWMSGIVWSDGFLRYCARWGVPAAFVFVILSGPVLPLIGGGLWPYPGLRSLHVLCGLGLILAVLYDAGSWAIRTAQRRSSGLRRRGGHAKAPGARLRMGLFVLHGALLATLLWTGVERYAGERWGIALLPLLTATQWSLLHRLVAPYYLAAFLIHSYVKSRLAWHTLLDQLRRP